MVEEAVRVAAEAGARRALERHGYVERVPDPSDRPAKLVRATARGRAAYATAREVLAGIERDWTARRGETKMRRLRELLAELIDRLAARDTDA